MTRTTGRIERTAVAGELVAAFIPDPLPPRAPPLELGPLAEALRRAESALARLQVAGAMVPSVPGFLYSFVRKEAIVSWQIEGTQATLLDLLRHEADCPTGEALPDDVHEVCNYLAALDYARAELRDPKGLPLSLRLLNETHRRLMQGVRGATKSPGEIRRSQNWIGGTRPGNAAYVPPPAPAVGPLLSALETFIHGDERLPPLVRAGLVHVQFESIHPYLDGNGRLGRLLIALLLEHWGLLPEPLLYLSVFFKQHRAEYYRRLAAVRSEGDFEGWLHFFIEGVAVVAAEAVATIRDLFARVSADRARLLAEPGASLVALRLFEQLPEHPIVTVQRAVTLLDTTKPTAIKAIGVLVAAGVLGERTGRRRDRAFHYVAYLERLLVGTELGPGGEDREPAS